MTPAEAKIKRWREDPLLFVQEALRVEPDPWQVDVLRAFPHKQRLAMMACKGPGKTAILSWLAWNFLATRVHPKMVATSISGANLADGLWTEMAKWQQRSEFLQTAFEWRQKRIFAKDHPETWYMSARTWKEGADSSQQANTLAGLHADNLLFILDEVGGIPDAVMAAADAGLSSGSGYNKDTKILMAGNPTHLHGPLYRAATSERHLWHITEITGDPDDPKRSPRVSVQWAHEQIEKYGRENPWVLVNVFGKFPPASLNTLLGPNEISESMRRVVDPKDYNFIQKRLGVDVARFGDDKTVIFPRQGLRAFNPVEMRNARNPAIAARIIQAKIKWGAETEFVDDTGGFGGGVVDSMIEGGHSPVPVNFAGKADDPRYFNKRAEIYFRLAEWVKGGGQLPNIPDLVRELTATEYTTKKGKLILIEKDQIKAKLNGHSPDLSDALALTFTQEDCPAAKPVLLGMEGNPHKTLHEWDPFDETRS